MITWGQVAAVTAPIWRMALENQRARYRELHAMLEQRETTMIRPITIKAVLNGFVCTVGCQEVVFDSKEKLVVALASYLDHPERMEKEFMASACNARQTGGPLTLGGYEANKVTEREQSLKCADARNTVPGCPITGSGY